MHNRFIGLLAVLLLVSMSAAGILVLAEAVGFQHKQHTVVVRYNYPVSEYQARFK